MRSPDDAGPALARARQLYAEGRLEEAEQAYRQLAAPGENRVAALEALADLYLQANRPRDAIYALEALTVDVPDGLNYYARLAALLEQFGEIDAAISHYQRLLKHRPQFAAAHFNLALLYKKGLRFRDALACYENAVKHGIENVEEVYSNMGVLYSERHDAVQAGKMYQQALAVRPDYIPALFNLAGLREESGQRDEAVALYERILSLDPRHWDSLARLAYARRVTEADAGIIDALRSGIAEAGDGNPAQEGLWFALGKALDDLGRYEEAFEAYRAANELGRRRNPPYDRSAAGQSIDQLIQSISPEWIETHTRDDTASPVFICGMFRSGSTLIEQVLASHPDVTAGGELEYLPRLIAHWLSPFPERLANTTREELGLVATTYTTLVREHFPDSGRITDKRPDNFLVLGLIKALFPNARIIYTRRNPLDNCLSIYFQQLGGNLSYATDLEDTAHYYSQHARLMSHWAACLGDALFTVDYDAFVGDPEPVLRRLLDFLGLEWSDRCLEFHRAGGQVKTASVWQVREGLHTGARERWRNYEQFLGAMPAILNVPAP